MDFALEGSYPGWFPTRISRADLHAKDAAKSQTILDLRAALAAAEMRERAAVRSLSNAEHTLDAVAHAWARTIRPSTAERRARQWMGRGDSGARVVAAFIERASA